MVLDNQVQMVFQEWMESQDPLEYLVVMDVME